MFQTDIGVCIEISFSGLCRWCPNGGGGCGVDAMWAHGVRESNGEQVVRIRLPGRYGKKMRVGAPWLACLLLIPGPLLS